MNGSTLTIVTLGTLCATSFAHGARAFSWRVVGVRPVRRRVPASRMVREMARGRTPEINEVSGAEVSVSSAERVLDPRESSLRRVLLEHARQAGVDMPYFIRPVSVRLDRGGAGFVHLFLVER